jgi:hypothetical protein
VSRIKDVIDFKQNFKVSNPSSLDRIWRCPETKIKKYNKCVFTNEDLKEDSELKKISAPCIEGENILKFLIHGDEKYTNLIWKDEKDIRSINKKTLNLMHQDKLVGQRITGQAKSRIVFTYDNKKYITMPSVNIINAITNNEGERKERLLYLLAILNSNLYNFLYKDIFGESNTNVTSDVFTTIPLIKNPYGQVKLAKYVDVLLPLKKQFYEIQTRFINRLKYNLKLEKITQNIEKFYTLGYENFLSELFKQKIKLKLEEQDEWEKHFNKYKHRLIQLQNQINTTDKEINEIVYVLYKLEPEEINIVEDALNS